MTTDIDTEARPLAPEQTRQLVDLILAGLAATRSQTNLARGYEHSRDRDAMVAADIAASGAWESVWRALYGMTR